jgi:hypothetical protein
MQPNPAGGLRELYTAEQHILAFVKVPWQVDMN